MRIGVVGCTGRMGQAVIRELAATSGGILAAAADRPGVNGIGQDAGLLVGLEPLGISVGDDSAKLFENCDAVIDFTIPEATIRHAELAITYRCALVVGTTGLTLEAKSALATAAQHVPLVAAPNMSLGVSLLAGLVERVARTLKDDFDIEIVEMHHRKKIDAPSGTALLLGHAAAAGRSVRLEDDAVWQRHGVTGARQPGQIGFAVLRGGDVVGDHTVVFAGDGERLELTHKASSRTIFAKGAVRAALWTQGRPPGLYGMADVLNLNA